MRKKWWEEIECDPSSHPVMNMMFHTSVPEGLPNPIRSRLEDVMGLTSKSFKEFCEHIVYAVNRHRKNEQKLKNKKGTC